MSTNASRGASRSSVFRPAKRSSLEVIMHWVAALLLISVMAKPVVADADGDGGKGEVIFSRISEAAHAHLPENSPANDLQQHPNDRRLCGGAPSSASGCSSREDCVNRGGSCECTPDCSPHPDKKKTPKEWNDFIFWAVMVFAVLSSIVSIYKMVQYLKEKLSCCSCCFSGSPNAATGALVMPEHPQGMQVTVPQNCTPGTSLQMQAPAGATSAGAP